MLYRMRRIACRREKTEGDRAFKKPFWFLIAGIMVIAFYLMSYVQLMDVHHLGSA
ncbi:hypothetical protein [Slackia exigua]|uniref:hypothetical protein n=1 Tax=Slackia exigua TaxID=84109 RepID=UPI0020054E3C|nr:hypothetical protein [Slackia exigua]